MDCNFLLKKQPKSKNKSKKVYICQTVMGMNLYIKLRKQGAVKAAAIVILGYGFVFNTTSETNHKVSNWIKNLNFID